MKFHKNLKIQRTYLNVYESHKKLNQIEFLKKIPNYYKKSGTKHPIKELSFLIFTLSQTHWYLIEYTFSNTKLL